MQAIDFQILPLPMKLFRLVYLRIGKLYATAGLSFYPESFFVAMGLSVWRFPNEYRVTLLLFAFAVDVGWLRDVPKVDGE
jgi:hypothetical protein